MYVHTETDLMIEDASGLHLTQKQIALWGSPLSVALLNPVYKIFRHPSAQGFVGYRLEAGCAIVFGDPVCPEESLPDLLQAFHEYCRQFKHNVIYVGVSEWFASWAMNRVCKISVEFGELLFCDPVTFDPASGSKGRLIRNKKRRARTENILVKEYFRDGSTIEEQIKAIEKSWLEARQGPQVYISHMNLFDDREGKRWFYAEKDGRVIAVLMLSRVETRQGWLLYHLMTLPKVPPGTSEQLVLSAVDTLREEGCRYFTLGAVPAAHLREINGVGYFTSKVIQAIYRLAKLVFPLEKLRKFWEKFHPQSERSFLLFSHSYIGLRDIRGLMKALNISF